MFGLGLGKRNSEVSRATKVMVNVKRLGYILGYVLCYVLFSTGIATLMAYSQEKPGEYVSPSEAVPRGRAPRMQIQLLNPGERTKQYAVIFYQGDEAFSGLLEFAEKYNVTSAHSPRLER